MRKRPAIMVAASRPPNELSMMLQGSSEAGQPPPAVVFGVAGRDGEVDRRWPGSRAGPRLVCDRPGCCTQRGTPRYGLPRRT